MGTFPLNSRIAARTGNAFYPDRCLGQGCAAWGVTSSIAFADTFCAELGIRTSYEHVREHLDVSV